MTTLPLRSAWFVDVDMNSAARETNPRELNAKPPAEAPVCEVPLSTLETAWLVTPDTADVVSLLDDDRFLEHSGSMVHHTVSNEASQTRVGPQWTPTLQALIERLDRLSDELRDLREGVQKAIHIADEDPEMALTRVRKVLEYVVRDVFERRINEPAGTRPLENLLDRLVKDGYFPARLDAYATTVRKLGNLGTHNFNETITSADVYRSLTQLMPILEWYFEQERPEAGVGFGMAHPNEKVSQVQPQRRVDCKRK
jgi:hypothetical protein